MWLAGTFLSAIGFAITVACFAWMFLASFAGELDVRMTSTQRGDGFLPKYDPEIARKVQAQNEPTIRWVRSRATPWAIAGVGLFLLGLFMSS